MNQTSTVNDDTPVKLRLLTIALTQGQAELLNTLRERFPTLKDDDIMAAALSVYEQRTRQTSAMMFPVS